MHELRQPIAAERYPKGWPDHQHSMEHHLVAATKRSAWRVAERDSNTDLVVVLANYSLFCIGGKTFGRRNHWYNMLHDRTLWKNSSQASWGEGAVLVSLQYAACGAPWADMVGSFRPANTLLISELKRRTDHDVLISPFVVSQPPWLVGDAPAPSAMPWAKRKLLFFAGHVPKLFQSEVRYHMWRQSRKRPDVTTHSWTILCTVGAYRECMRSDEELVQIGAQLEREHPEYSRSRGGEGGLVVHLATHCHRAGICPNTSSCDASRVRSRSVPTSALLHGFRRRCAPYRKHVNYSDELPDMLRCVRAATLVSMHAWRPTPMAWPQTERRPRSSAAGFRGRACTCTCTCAWTFMYTCMCIMRACRRAGMPLQGAVRAASLLSRSTGGKAAAPCTATRRCLMSLT